MVCWNGDGVCARREDESNTTSLFTQLQKSDKLLQMLGLLLHEHMTHCKQLKELAFDTVLGNLGCGGEKIGEETRHLGIHFFIRVIITEPGSKCWKNAFPWLCVHHQQAAQTPTVAKHEIFLLWKNLQVLLRTCFHPINVVMENFAGSEWLLDILDTNVRLLRCRNFTCSVAKHAMIAKP